MTDKYDNDTMTGLYTKEGMARDRARYKAKEEEEDVVNEPSHYKTETGLEVIDVIESFDLDYNLGNVTKYVLRAGKKENAKEDLLKAIWYIERYISTKLT